MPFIQYIDKYYLICAIPFFNSLPDMQSLDEITENTDIYGLGLYLSSYPYLKKIILSSLTNNPNRDKYYSDYKNILESDYSNPETPKQRKIKMQAALSSLDNIKK
jgi:hypothetical protein